MRRDEEDVRKPMGQRTRDTFELGDVFFRIDEAGSVQVQEEAEPVLEEPVDAGEEDRRREAADDRVEPAVALQVEDQRRGQEHDGHLAEFDAEVVAEQRGASGARVRATAPGAR